ncbi:MAG: class I SAM-dependent methyltransferase [Minisyncoccota bacterium]
MNKKEQTINTYNNSAKALANKFNGQGARIVDIETVLALVKKENPKVLEIGCGNGRDAVEICKKTNDYLGIDISEKLVGLAKQKVPSATFEVVDIETFEFPKDLDVIFAFASLIHVQKNELRDVLSKALSALNDGGVLLLSMKYAAAYKESTKEDEFGVRTYYLYSQEDIKELSTGFTILKNELHDLRGQMWLEVLLQK